MRVEEERTKLYVPHLDGEITFAHLKIGPGTYASVGTEISAQELIRPTMAQTVSLVYSAFQNKDNKYSQEIKKILKDKRFWGFTGNRYVKSDKGIYIEDNPEIKKGRVLVDNRDNLIKRLESNDDSVRFVPFGFRTEEQFPENLEKNPYVIGLAGEEGAEKLAEVADMYKLKPCVFVLNNDIFINEIIRVSALGSGWSFGKRLALYGDFADDGGGDAFGMFDAEGVVNEE